MILKWAILHNEYFKYILMPMLLYFYLSNIWMQNFNL